MKNVINFFAVSLIVLSGSALHAAQNTSGIQVQVEQTKTAGVTGALNSPYGSTGLSGAAGSDAVDVIPGEKSGTFVADHDLAKDIYKAIRDDRTISSDSKIKVIVTVFNGKVTLSGDVINEAEKARAELLANQVNRLKGVVNNIRVVK